MYAYFVSFSYLREGGANFGCIEVSLREPVTNMDQVRKLHDGAESGLGVALIAVLNFKLLRKDEKSL